MPRHRLLPLALVALAATACGSAGAGGEAAARVVKGDWEFNHAFTGPDARYAAYDSVDQVTCQRRPSSDGNVRCTLHVSSAERPRPVRVLVVVHYDQHGVLQGWDIVPPRA